MGISRGRMVRDPVERRCLNRVFFRHRDRCDTCADAVHVDVVCTRKDVGRAQPNVQMEHYLHVCSACVDARVGFCRLLPVHGLTMGFA
jgi:hypothetical protein